MFYAKCDGEFVFGRHQSIGGENLLWGMDSLAADGDARPQQGSQRGVSQL